MPSNWWWWSRLRAAPQPRAPLPPFDPDSTDPDTGAPLHVNTTLPMVPPAPCARYWRTNFCGIHVPGLPPVPGGAADPSLVFAPFLDRYPTAHQDRIIEAHLDRGYDRLLLSWPDSRSGNGLSLNAYTGLAMRVQSAGLVPAHMLLSKVYDSSIPDYAALDATLDAIVSAGVETLCCVGWELNLFLSPETLHQLLDHLSNHWNLPTIHWYVHFSTHYASWQEDGHGGGDFWNAHPFLTGLLYQCDPAWSAGMMQARLNDVLVRLKQGGPWGCVKDFDTVAFETTAQSQFNGLMDEDHGDLKGYETLCTVGPMSVMGFGNGARLPDGHAV